MDKLNTGPELRHARLRQRLNGFQNRIGDGGDEVNGIRSSTNVSVTLGVGELTEFDPHSPAEYPAVAGVYVLYDISERPLYVGQGRAIDKRIRNHNDKFWFKSPIVESASYIRIDDQSLRERIEAVLIKFLKSNAVINKQLVDR